ncbi:putative glycosyltransferase [Forsythia ovata]|uniref:Glycosyltransferase n=1 Tax=Forsythia ovata TaxID=205694 RepID=A0ABD1SJJ7_9LAMI
MDFCFKGLYAVQIKQLLSIIVIAIAVLVFSQTFTLLYGNYLPSLSRANGGILSFMVSSTNLSNRSKSDNAYIVHDVFGNDNTPDGEASSERDAYNVISSDGGGDMNALSEIEERNLKLVTAKPVKGDTDAARRASNGSHHIKSSNQTGFGPLNQLSPRDLKFVSQESESLGLSVATNTSTVHDDKIELETHRTNEDNELLQVGSLITNFSAIVAVDSALGKRGGKPTSISQMNSLLLTNSASLKAMRPLWSSPRDKELQHAKLEIKNAPIIRDVPEVHASLFRNYSTFRRSYELMERMLKVYVYREGEKPIFHQPHLRGIYASEGWFMKLMDGNKKFVVRDPKKAHLFYIPFSSLKLRNALHEPNFASQKDLENHLKNYVDTVARKYRFWNRTKGADHFFAACHDWAIRFTRNNLGSCIRVLCNSNIARGFKIGKDVSLPVTYIRSGENPSKDLGGIHPSKRHILAFFAGGMHGYVRPILLQYWNNREPDMKIFGPMPRDIEGKARYREFMKSSRYCICAKGYEVHTPRVVESIYYECVPVIISDNYVPPFFDVLNWEAFALFILEKDIPNLRGILLSIPEEKYTVMQQRLKIVQQYFVWHKIPEKYDLFHMILHSVWYNRVLQVKP